VHAVDHRHEQQDIENDDYQFAEKVLAEGGLT
jgi:hypothetical protein